MIVPLRIPILGFNEACRFVGVRAHDRAPPATSQIHFRSTNIGCGEKSAWDVDISFAVVVESQQIVHRKTNQPGEREVCPSSPGPANLPEFGASSF